MDNIEKLQKEIELTKELIVLKEKLLEIEKQFGAQRIEYVPIYPYPTQPIQPYPYPTYDPYRYTTTGGLVQ